jgi:hypothetical protein
MRTTEQFSSDDELDFNDYYDDDGNSSPVTFARYDLADIDEDTDLVDPRPPSIRSFVPDGRRGSLPMTIPGTVQPSDAYSIRSREGSILTVRRPSRSWDDASTYRSSHGGDDPSHMLPKSEPNSRADWLSIEAQIQAKQPQQQQPQQEQEQEQEQPPVLLGACEGFDLSYIMSRPSEGSIRSGRSGLSFVQGGMGNRISSPYLFRAAGSSVTLPFEDTFMRHIQKSDQAFDPQRYYWSFQRERADASNSSLRRRQQAQHHRHDKSGKETGPRVQEMWRCGHVGRFKVDKIVFKPQSTDSTKGTQQRIHVRHIPDPFLGSTSGGPHSVIHKHSRAIAFSIFRSHSLFSGRQPGAAGAGPSSAQTHMNMRSGIMLAPKKVQEQYTSTKTMRHLNTYGFLESESRGGRGAQGHSARQRDRERRRGDDRSKGKTLGKSKGKDKSEKKAHRANPTESTESSSAGSVTNNATKTLISAAGEQPTLKIQFSPSVSSSMSTSQRDSISRPSSPSSSLPTSTMDSVNLLESETSSTPLIQHYHRDSIDSDDRFPARTTHAEAFSALDPNDIESLRAKASNRANADSSSTLAERLLRRVFGSGSRPDDNTSGAPTRAFQPPWLTTAGRDQQEENDRVLNDLNASFRDVGLLHTNPHRALKVTSKRRSSQGILDEVPDESLYMLLPLWPGETDTVSVQAETSSAASFVTVPDNRQYLLVYYVPFTDADSKNKKHKKKAKQSHSSDSGIEVNSKSIYLPAFRAVARVVTYDELRFSGVRVPSDGLAISGPEWEAMSYSDSAAARDSELSSVVCQCLGKDSGFGFLEDGLLKLGLCTPDDTSSQVEDIWAEIQGPVPPAKLQVTAIGKAVMEMIWLGCLALTSFGPT